MEGHSSREMKAERMRSEIKKRQKKKKRRKGNHWSLLLKNLYLDPCVLHEFMRKEQASAISLPGHRPLDVPALPWNCRDQIQRNQLT